MNILDKFAKEQNWYKLSDPKNFKEYIKPIQNNDGGIIKVPYWFEDKLNEFVNEEMKKIKQEGRVEGAKTELQNCIKDLEASLEFYECDYGKFEQQVVDKVIEELTENINKFKKHLKEKEVKGVN